MKKGKSIYQSKDFFIEAIKDPWYLFLANLYNTIYDRTTNFYQKKNIKTLLLPTTSSNVSSPMGLGSDSTPVEIQINGMKTYLSDSMQFLLEYGCRIHKKGCYSLMPSYRGENPDNRHLSQFFHSEAEIVGDMSLATEIAEDYLKYITNEIYTQFKEQLYNYCNNLKHIESLLSLKSIPQITLQEAISYLKISDNEYVYNKEYNFKYLTPKGEKKLIEKYEGFVWIYDFDHLSMPFYQAFSEYDNYKAKAADLLMGMGETIGLGERHENGIDVRKALDFHNIPHKEYESYIKLKEIYPLKTSGFGLGVERFICWILQHENIRDCQLFLRFNDLKESI